MQQQGQQHEEALCLAGAQNTGSSSSSHCSCGSGTLAFQASAALQAMWSAFERKMHFKRGGHLSMSH
jgi:hypothetical protein